MPDPAPQPAATPAAAQGGVFALGNFDGVHRGHQAVVRAAVEKAHALNVPARVLTFEPHPRSVFKPDTPPFRLTPAPVKAKLLQALGVDSVIVHPFTLEFSRLPAMDFVEKLLVEKYGIRHAVTGFDFVFGHGRQGNMQNLRRWLAPHNIGVTEVTPFRDSHGEIMSSSRTREALQAGDLQTVEHILGRPWSITGTVVHGAHRGRQISIPTANIPLGEYQRPKFGVYAVQAGPSGKPPNRQGVANIGVRPTVDGKNEMLEFHLFDFSEEIYGDEWEVVLMDFIRPEKTFSGIDALREQILLDIEEAKARLERITQ